MKFLQGVLFLLWRVLRVLLWAWVPAVGALLARIRAWLQGWREELARPPRERRQTDQLCSPIRHPAMQRPDPLIYSQQYLASLGLAITWDNPDIQLFKEGVMVPSSGLDPDTEYQVVARIWNGSTTAPVVGLPVRFTLHGFGIGTAGVPLGATTVDLGVRGGANHPAFATITWTTPATAGHFCIRTHLDWIDDANPANNQGQENTRVGAPSSPAQFSFLLRNDDRERRRAYRLQANGYAIPEPPDCRERPPPDRNGLVERRRRELPRRGVALPAEVRARHDRSAHPVPPGWSVDLAPSQAVLTPGEQVEVEVTVTPPEGFAGTQPIVVDAFDEIGLAGGVTFLVSAE
jgi:hypothetical protein